MSDAIALLRAVLGDACATDRLALDVLDAALALEVDPLDLCAHRFGLSQGEVWKRAAFWVGVAYHDDVPRRVAFGDAPIRLDGLGTVRAIKGDALDREIVIAAPDFMGMLRLRSRVARDEKLVSRLSIVSPNVLTEALARAAQVQLSDDARQRLVRRWPHATAGVDLTIIARLTCVGFLLILLALAIAAPFWNRAMLMPVLGLLLLVPAAMRFLAAARRPVSGKAPAPLPDSDLPVYSVLIPLHHEANMVPKLRRAMERLDYPPEKLDICFVVEERSTSTIAAVAQILGDPRFRLIRVPDSLPRTKPKALNFALPLTRGEYVVVYDAEDEPDADQLRLAASRFVMDPGLTCLQAELVIDNAEEKPLTALFAGEYAGLFGFMLPALARWGLPLPLGGTSNHFRVSTLRDLGGWDAFNVTEDADLGVRLARAGCRTETLESQTREEAPISLRAWMVQRTRWMKGWMQTFVVHNRHPRETLAQLGWKGFVAFELLVGSMIISSLLHTAFFGTFALQLLSGSIPVFDIWFYLHLVILALGYGGALSLTIVGLIRLGQWRLLPVQVMLPIYWVLHSIATGRAAIELILRPYAWAKTRHGESQLRRPIGQQATI